MPDEELPPLSAYVEEVAPRKGNGSDGRAHMEQDGEVADSHWPAALDLEALAESEPERPRHIIDRWLPEGEVTLLAAHGGSGKSAIALHLAVCIALGVPWHGLATERRRVVYISAEDPREVLHWRLGRIASHLGVRIADLAGHLDLLDVAHLDAELMAEVRGDEPFLTVFYTELRERMAGAQVLVLDGVSDLYGASEIVRRHVRRFIRALRRLIPADGAALILAHIDKALARGKETGDHYSGSTAWNNSVRARWALRADGDGLILAVEKANHAQAGAEIRLRWDADTHMHVADAAPAEGGIVASIRERTERDGILAALRACNESVPAAATGPRTAYHVLIARPELPQSLRDGATGRRRFWARIEELRAMDAVRESSIRRSDRHFMRVLQVSTPVSAGNAGNG